MDVPNSQPVEGYPRLACYMAQYPENTMFRRFSSLGIRNLLYLQAELIYLEQKLYHIEAADEAASEGHRARYSRDWYWLNNSPGEGTDEQLRTVLSIRNDTIVQQSVVSCLAKPDDCDLRVLQDWLERPVFGNLALIGADRETWGRLDQPSSSFTDLLTQGPTRREDSFSRWFSQKFLTWFHYTLRHRLRNSGDLESGIISYSSSLVERYTSFVTTMVASLLPILSKIVLYFVPSMKLRLGFTVLFALVFTACISSFTSAKRGEIFLATSAFAAVQVVFISSNNGWDNTA